MNGGTPPVTQPGTQSGTQQVPQSAPQSEPRPGNDRPLLVVTGGMGRVAGVLRPRLRPRYRLRLVDRVGGPVTQDEELVVTDLASKEAARSAMVGADALLHLAGEPSPTAQWERLYATNIVLTERVLAAAADVPRIVFGSSVHAAGGDSRPERYPIDPAWEPHPCCAYGMSKVVGEALARMHADTHGSSVVSLRLGLTGFPLTDPGHARLWLSDDDAGRLVTAALTAEPGYGVHFGVSANAIPHWDTTSSARDLGYLPQDDPSDVLAEAAEVSRMH
ncbi:NAD-dependent epimerase/dehydratase family protein [Streptomyces sp. CA-111067]|uniref:NAD-dependent epimerase/dehydratase family protein n=1 Tax=Streptomyces sp. CA-111067 TaxID=3240046 RepID=UPI003D958BF3